MSSPSPQHPTSGPFSAVVEVAETGSTNTDLVVAVLSDDAAWPHLSVLRAEHQVAGRGRTGREWTTPAGTSLTFSTVLRPRRRRADWATLSLVAGLAVVTAVRALPTAGPVPLDAALKWPNDVLLRPFNDNNSDDGSDDDGAAHLPGWGPTRKVAGILAEIVPGREALVLGIGVNVAQRAPADLPVAWATSLALAGAATDPRALMLAIGDRLAALLARWEADGFEALLAEVEAVTDTIGREIDVDLGEAGTLSGSAEGIGADGTLLVRTADGAGHRISAGDVVRARRA